ncbi:hypothetical protein SAMN05192553_101887 [Cyclobacterium xiamenense]|uniref:Uncharacterized protein n=1 Tax=Cyclobacterium xiamenense TaxID=1297121 RepID=A0A1H6UKH5_9BACT|nr:hypothetical protein [Cyclobacterium xiamenense]SEI92798.1 hypothetical protein SAMN05192553_101887 [Cyclobacterium xiamenense]
MYRSPFRKSSFNNPLISSFLVALSLIVYAACQPAVIEPDENELSQAMQNGYLAHEGYTRSLSFVNDWLAHADPETGLIPRNLRESADIWNAQDAAADNYPFMVMTASILDKSLYEGRLAAILETEKRLTNRLDRLPDTYSFSKKGFDRAEVNKDAIIFGASEYVKDGLLPLTEYIGQTPWSDRMRDILDDIWKNASYETPYGRIPSLNVEVNGELLQVLSRVYWMSGDKKYLEWALRLGDYYLLDEHHPTDDFEILRLRDHGCEIVSGLCELYLTTAHTDEGKKNAYQPAIYRMLDRILEVGTNEHGLFYNQINPQTGEILDEGIADTWGYTFNAYYSVYLLDQYEPYREAVIRALENLDQYAYYDWERGSSDGYADAIESALNLYNREPLPETKAWIDSQTQHMWSLQDSAYRPDTEAYRGNGIIEGWHGDGNFARTTLMYCLWKTQGVTAEPWQPELYLGAVARDSGVLVSLLSEEAWEGKITFDRARHRHIFQLPLDYPRINQLPEWFVVAPDKKYRVTFPTGNTSGTYRGEELLEGLALKLEKNQQISLIIQPLEH